MVKALKETIETHLLAPQQLLDKYKDYLDFISNKFKYKGLEKNDVYNQAYLELLKLCLQFPETTDIKLKSKVTHKLENYYRKEKKHWDNDISINAILDEDDDEDDKPNVIDKQTAKEYFRTCNRSIPTDILDLREKEIIDMYYFFRYKEEEIANHYNLSHQRINKIKSKALKKMRNALLEK